MNPEGLLMLLAITAGLGCVDIVLAAKLLLLKMQERRTDRQRRDAAARRGNADAQS